MLSVLEFAVCFEVSRFLQLISVAALKTAICSLDCLKIGV